MDNILTFDETRRAVEASGHDFAAFLDDIGEADAYAERCVDEFLEGVTDGQ